MSVDKILIEFAVPTEKITKLKLALLEIIKGVKPKKADVPACKDCKYAQCEVRGGQEECLWLKGEGFNQGVEATMKAIEDMFK